MLKMILKMKLRHPDGKLVDFHKLCRAFLEGLAYTVLTLSLLTGCTVNVDKRSYSAIYLTPEATLGSSVNVHVTPSVTNASETQMEQAIDGNLSVPLLP